MLQLYDKNHNKIRGIENYKDLKIESDLTSSDGTLSFLISKNNSEGIEHEGYLRTKEQEYVIKEAPLKDKWNEVVANLNLEDLKGNAIRNFDSTEQTIDKCIQLAIAGSGYTVEIKDNITKRRTVRATDTNTFEILNSIKDTYLVEIKFDTINKKVLIYEKIGSDKGAYFMDSLNLRNLEVTGDSYEFFTKLIAYGASNQETGQTLRVEVTNNTYSNKVTTTIWKDERYTDEDSLREDAQYKLNEIAKPKKSYAASIYDLANMNEEYKNILDYDLGDTITVIDKEKGIKEKLRIIKVIKYPLSPEKNEVELSNAVFTFEQLMKAQKQYESTVDNITSDNGTVSPEAIKSSILSLINVNIQSLSAVSARIGELFTNQLKADVANISTGIVGKLLAQKIEVKDLVASNVKFDIAEGGSLSVKDLLTQFLSAGSTETLHITAGNAVFDDAVIKDAMIESVKADKIISGSIDTNKVNILAQKDGYKLTITGRIIQFIDSNSGTDKVIGQMGFDASNNFTFSVMDKEGNYTIYDSEGITKHAVPDGLIVNDMVADDANIGGEKLNIESIIKEVNNNNTQVIKGSKIHFDSTGQNAEVSFKKITETMNNLDAANKNLVSYNTDNWIQGDINASTGVEGTSEYYIKTKDYIHVTAGKYTITKYDINNFDIYILIYDSSKKFIRGPGLVNDMTYTTNLDDGFIRLMVRKKITEPRQKINITELKNYKFKVETGENSTDFSYNQEDVGKLTHTLQTGFNIQQGQIEQLIKDTTITESGTTKTLKDAYNETKSTVDGTVQTVAKHETKINNLKIGTKNLLRNTLDFSGGSSIWEVNNATLSDTKWDDFTVAVITKDWGSYRQRHKYAIGKEYTFSFYAKAENQNVQLKFYNTNSTLSDNNAGGNNTTITDNCSTLWTRYSVTFTSKADIGLIRVEPSNISITGGKLLVCGYMLEEGNMLSSYSQAQEDLQSDINSIEQKVSSVETKVTDEAFSVQVQKNQNKVYNIRYIRDYCSGSTANGGCHWVEIQAISNFGSNLAKGKSILSNKTIQNSSYITDGNTSSDKFGQCTKDDTNVPHVQIDLGQIYNNVDEIKVWHYYADGRTYHKTKTMVSADGVNWITLFDSAISGEYIETKFGHSIKVNGTSFNSSLTTINENGLDVKEGAISITNKAGTKVLEGDVNGNLKYVGIMEQRDPTTGYLAAALKYNGLGVYDWRLKDDLVGGIVATEMNNSKRGTTTIFADKGNILTIGWRDGDGSEEDFGNSTFSTVMQIDDTAQQDPGYVTSFYKSMAFNNTPHFRNGIKMVNYGEMEYYGNDYNIPLGESYVSEGNNYCMMADKKYGDIRLGCKKDGGYYSTIGIGDGGCTIWGNLHVTGAKNRIFKTKNFGILSQNAYEMCEPYFGDEMFAKTDSEGYCVIPFEDRFLETVNTKYRYHVFCSAYGGDDDIFPLVKCIEQTENYFIIKSNYPDVEFSVKVDCRQFGYEMDRLEKHDVHMNNEEIKDNFIYKEEKEEDEFLEDFNDFEDEFLEDFNRFLE